VETRLGRRGGKALKRRGLHPALGLALLDLGPLAVRRTLDELELVLALELLEDLAAVARIGLELGLLGDDDLWGRGLRR
jgi:hypothetical protein